MKKITAIAILSITIFACNKQETKKITKLNPDTGKTEVVEVPVKTDEGKPVKMGISDEGNTGVFTQKFVLEVGKTYPLTTVQKDTQTMTAPNGQSQSGSSTSEDGMSFTVNKFENGIYDIIINLLSKKSTQSGNGKTITVDTNAGEPKEEQLKMIWKVNKALVGNKLSLKMKENGEVVSISGFDAIYNKIAESAAAQIKDAKVKANFIEGFKKSFDEKALKEQFTKNLIILPAKGVKVGEKWTKSENASADGKTKFTTTYTLKSVENGIAEISLSGGIPYKSDKQSQQGMTHSMSAELSQNGTVKLDQMSGWIQNQTINLKSTQKESISDGKKTQTVTSVTNSTVVVNPAK